MTDVFWHGFVLGFAFGVCVIAVPVSLALRVVAGRQASSDRLKHQMREAALKEIGRMKGAQG